jgi:hypothetical protein
LRPERRRPTLPDMRRFTISLFLIGAALIPSACTPPTILSVQTCPVYQPPETPHPDWPKVCGGQR